MISRRDSNNAKRKIIAYIAFGVLVVLSWFVFRNFINIPLQEVNTLTSQSGTFLVRKINGIYLYFASNDALYKENIRLNNELTIEKQRYIEVIELRDKVAKYEKFTDFSGAEHLFAKRVGFVDSLIHKTFRINKGNRNTILYGQKVITQQKVIIGKVAEVFDITSLISLLWNGDPFLGRMSRSGTVITLKGTGNGVYVAEVPHELEVKIDDIILFDEDPEYIVGLVKKINNNDEDVFKEIVVHTPLSPNMIDVVLIK